MDTKTKAMLAQLTAQRNNALDMVAELVGLLSERDEKISALESAKQDADRTPPAHA